MFFYIYYFCLFFHSSFLLSFTRFTLDASTYTSYISTYYPRGNKELTTKSITYYCVITAPMYILTSNRHAYMGKLTIWKDFLGLPNINSVPTNAFYHPDYSNPLLFGYYPFRYGFLDESGKGNHLEYPNTLTTCEFKEIGSFGTFQGVDEVEMIWSAPTSTFTYLGGTRDGCRVKFTFDQHLLLRDVSDTHSTDVESCGDILSPSEYNLLGTNSRCMWDPENEKIISVCLSADTSLATSQTLTILSSNLYLSEGTSSPLVYTHNTLPPLPSFSIAEGVSVEFNAWEGVTLTLLPANLGTGTATYTYTLITPNSSLSVSQPTTTTLHFQSLDSYVFTVSITNVLITMSTRECENYIYRETLNLVGKNRPRARITGGNILVGMSTKVELNGNESTGIDLTYIWECAEDADFQTPCLGQSLSGERVEVNTSTCAKCPITYHIKLKVVNEYGNSDIARTCVGVGGSGSLSFTLTHTEIDREQVPTPLPHELLKVSSTNEHIYTVNIVESNNGNNLSGLDVYWEMTPSIGKLHSEKHSLHIRGSQMHPGVQYTLRVSIYNGGSGSWHTLNKSIETSELPTAPNVRISPTQGIGFQTKYSVSVEGSGDPEGGALRYRYGYAQIQGGEVNLTGWLFLDQYTLILPIGSRYFNRQITVIVEIANEFGSAIVRSVNVTSDIVTTTNINIISTYTQILLDNVGDGDPQYILGILGGLVELVGGVDIEREDHEKLQKSMIKQLRSSIYSSYDSMSVRMRENIYYILYSLIGEHPKHQNQLEILQNTLEVFMEVNNCTYKQLLSISTENKYERILSERGMKGGFGVLENAMESFHVLFKGGMREEDTVDMDNEMRELIFEFGHLVEIGESVSPLGDRQSDNKNENGVLSVDMGIYHWTAGLGRNTSLNGGLTLNGLAGTSLMLPLNFSSYLHNQQQILNLTYHLLSHGTSYPHLHQITQSGIDLNLDLLSPPVHLAIYSSLGVLTLQGINTSNSLILKIGFQGCDEGYIPACYYYNQTARVYQGVDTLSYQMVGGAGVIRCALTHLSEFVVIRQKYVPSSLSTTQEICILYIYIYIAEVIVENSSDTYEPITSPST